MPPWVDSMPYNYIRICIPLFSLACNVLIQVCFARYIVKLGLMKSIFLGFVLGFLALGVFEAYVYQAQVFPGKEALVNFVVHSMAYTALAYCYFHFINLGETARRIRILRELQNSDNGLSLEEILKRYNAKSIIDVRISRLINNGQIKLRNEKYYIDNPTVLYAAKFLAALKFIFLGKREALKG